LKPEGFGLLPIPSEIIYLLSISREDKNVGLILQDLGLGAVVGGILVVRRETFNAIAIIFEEEASEDSVRRITFFAIPVHFDAIFGPRKT
jgi:hypothetical protein